MTALPTALSFMTLLPFLFSFHLLYPLFFLYIIAAIEIERRDSFGILSHPLRGFGALRYLPLVLIGQAIIIDFHFSNPFFPKYC